MTTITKITAVVAAGNFESEEDAAAWANALRAVAAERHPEATIDVTVASRQDGGGHVRAIDADGDDNEDEADILGSLATRRAF